jgi:metallopeptidase MepB
VEAPSQMLENWCFQPAELKRLSKHFETGKTLPDELISKVVATQTVLQAIAYLRQLQFGLYDIGIHTLQREATDEDLQKVSDDIFKTVALRDTEGERIPLHETFAHLV